MGNLRNKKDKKKNKIIDQQIEKEKNQQENKIQILVAGTGDSGKSTFVKQMKILYKGGFSKTEKKLYRDIIRENLKINMKRLIRASEELNLNLQKINLPLVDRFFEILQEKSDEIITEEMKDILVSLWKDPTLKETYNSRSLFQIPDSTNFYMDKVQQICKINYSPTKEDILGSRIPTTGVKEVILDVNEQKWVIIDVGGQRSERRKWIHQFDSINLMIFVIAMSEYDQKLFEEQNIYRMAETLKFFKKLVNDKLFKHADLIILLNKIDLFEEKIQKVDLNVCFEDYQGGLDKEAAIEFIKDKFTSTIQNKNRNIWTHFSCATNTEMIENIFEEIKKNVQQAL
ncbi:guanine nucleotide-binding protein g(o) subunit alpha [Anaeramoeba flamelloides]|uniref:Guanine nucleotide-binding protein g(O) subunit alpha n=1 Tax=Anaeramoeba flamelloides TaxID=1746091 RepID=A0AAV7ZQR5_9EUKA|nr:guanine nucleotide-binding protein g(o) subunit alpha [Anaeramoeba flamelloides]KAJ6254672.1 guanine nucleotide-binding protein g(o) subunit alpha [Anaeramoeba flamelloides]